MHGIIALTDDQTTEFNGMTTTAPQWCALLVQSNAERKCCIWLKRRGFSPYWARFKASQKLNRHRRAMRWKSVIAGYLFLPKYDQMNWKLIEDAPGVRGFLRMAGEIVSLPESGEQGIAKIREIEDCLNASPVAAAQGIPFKVKQKVRVAKLEMEAIIIKIESARLIELEGNIFGRVTKIRLPVTEIEAI